MNLHIPHAVRDQLTKLMNSHPEFSACADTTAAFIIQTCEFSQETEPGVYLGPKVWGFVCVCVSIYLYIYIYIYI